MTRHPSVEREDELLPDACGKRLHSGRWCNHARVGDLNVCRLHDYADGASDGRRRSRRSAQEAALAAEVTRAARMRALTHATEQARAELESGGTAPAGGFDAARLAVLLAQMVAAVDRWRAL